MRNGNNVVVRQPTNSVRLRHFVHGPRVGSHPLPARSGVAVVVAAVSERNIK
jgi:hypothetical protein